MIKDMIKLGDINNIWQLEENELRFFENESSLAEYKKVNTYVRVVLKTTNNSAKDYWVEKKNTMCPIPFYLSLV